MAKSIMATQMISSKANIKFKYASKNINSTDGMAEFVYGWGFNGLTQGCMVWICMKTAVFDLVSVLQN